MQATASGYKLIKKIKDEKFEEDNLQNYSLLIQFSNRDLQVGVIDSKEKRLIFFEDYVFSEIDSQTDLLNLFKDLYKNHSLLTAGFWKDVKISVKHDQFVQIPTNLFDETLSDDYLKFNAAVDTDSKILWCHSENSGSVTVFGLNRYIHDWIKSVYTNTTVKFLHQSTSLITGIVRVAAHSSTLPLYIFVDRFKLHIVSVENKKLVYYNQFLIKHFSDYIKYIMLVMNMLKLDQKTSKVILWGYIGKNSAHYQEFYKYISNVEFGARPDHLRFGYLFDEVQDHGYLDLLSLHLVGN